MDRLNILVISRIILPALSPRAFRTTELAKELSRLGHNVTVYAVLGNYDYSEFEKESGVKVRNIGKMLLGSSDSEGNYRYTLMDKILYHSLNRLLEYPDIELMFRIPGILKKESKTDFLITIAHPHQIHWGAALAKMVFSKNTFPKVWVSDCGDPYTLNPFSKKSFFYFIYVEKWWGRKTDCITIPLEAGKIGYYPEFHPKIQVIPQGFDFTNIKIDKSFEKNSIPTFAYSGSIYPGQRDPRSFLNYLSLINFNFKFVIYTSTPDYYSEFKVLLNQKLELKPYITREQLIFELSKMDFLINFKNPDTIQLPSKIIDYLQTNRPIMEVSSNFSELESTTFIEFINGNFENRLVEFDIQQFNIRNVAQKFVHLYYKHNGQETNDSPSCLS